MFSSMAIKSALMKLYLCQEESFKLPVVTVSNKLDTNTRTVLHLTTLPIYPFTVIVIDIKNS